MTHCFLCLAIASQQRLSCCCRPLILQKPCCCWAVDTATFTLLLLQLLQYGGLLRRSWLFLLCLQLCCDNGSEALCLMDSIVDVSPSCGQVLTCCEHRHCNRSPCADSAWHHPHTDVAPQHLLAQHSCKAMPQLGFALSSIPCTPRTSQTSSCDVFCVPLQALKMLADYQQTTRRPMQSTMQSTRSGVLSQRIVAFKSDKASPNPSGVSHGVEGLAIPSIGPFVSGSDGNLQEASTIGT